MFVFFKFNFFFITVFILFPAPGRRERLCGLLWSSDRVVVIYYIPPDSATSIHFNITYYSKRRGMLQLQQIIFL